MSIPRIGWNDCWGSVLEALSPFKIPCMRFTGAFWGQCMQRALEQCVADDLDWILTIDYDSMFTSKHLDAMFAHFGQNPKIDALAALQCRRTEGFPLMTVMGSKEVEVKAGEPILVTTAHFGLTLLRVERLKQLEKPWLWAKPDDEGSWGDNRLDDDIWFWHQWRKSGGTIYVAPDVRIGHLEVMVSQFTPDMKAEHIHVNEWRNQNK